MGKIGGSVLLKLFINGNEKCHTTDAQYHRSRTEFPREPKDIAKQQVVWATFYSHHTSTKHQL